MHSTLITIIPDEYIPHADPDIVIRYIMIIPREIIIGHENDYLPFRRQQRNKRKCNYLASFRERHCHAFCLL